MIAHPIAQLPRDYQSTVAPPPDHGLHPSFADLLAAPAGSSLVRRGDTASGSGPTGDAVLAAKNKRKDDGSDTATPAAVPTPPSQPAPSRAAGGDDNNATATQANSADAAGAKDQGATKDAAQRAAAGQAGAAADGKGGSTTAIPSPPGAAELNARVAAGAPLLVSQPSTSLATLPHDAKEIAAAHARAAHGTEAADAVASGGKGQGPQTATPGQGGNADKASTPSTGLQAATADAIAASQAQIKSIADPAVRLDGASNSGSQAAPGADPGAAGASLAASAANGTAPAPAQAPQVEQAVRTPLLLHTATEQVAINLKQAAKSGVDQIEIQLKPASLGTIDVKLNLTHDGRVMAVISADRSDTLNLLQRDASGLQQALRDAGLQADSGSLSFNLRGDARSDQQGARQRDDGRGSAASGDDILAAIAGPALRRHAGTLDIQV